MSINYRNRWSTLYSKLEQKIIFHLNNPAVARMHFESVVRDETFFWQRDFPQLLEAAAI
jgi:hypothetical protein